MFTSIAELNARYHIVENIVASISLPIDICKLIGMFENQRQFTDQFERFIGRGGVFMVADRDIRWIISHTVTEHGRNTVILHQKNKRFVMSISISIRDMWNFITGSEFPLQIVAEEELPKEVTNEWRDEIHQWLGRRFIANEVASVARQRFAGRTAI
jgi:hypothetical protein